MKKRYFLILVVVIAFALQAHSQVTTSSLHGTIVDSENVPLPDATVVAVHIPTGTNYGSTTNIDGQVNIHNMRIGGPYTITMSFVGFQTQELENVSLTLGQTFDFDMILVSDNRLEEVVLTTTGDNIFGGERTGAETSIGREAISTLPTISRSAADFTR